MFLIDLSLLTRLTGIVFCTFFITFGFFPGVPNASPRLPNVTPEMESPGFWIKKIKNPTKLLLIPEKIQRMNEENLKRPDLYLCRIKDLKENWRREEILSLLREDWKKFGRTEAAQDGKNGSRLGELLWNQLRDNLNEKSVQEDGRMVFALIVRPTDIRVFPTDEPPPDAPRNDAFDRFQQSSISAGSPIGVYHFSRDKKWAYVQTPFIRGWIRGRDLAIAKERVEVADYEEAKDRLVITGSLVTVFDDPSLRHPAFIARMGDSFPLLDAPGNTQDRYVISIPSRDENAPLTVRKGYLRADEDVHRGFLPYHQENVARQAFKMLRQPYGWGDRLGGRDCSRFIMDLFRTFGFLMPRNSDEQAMVGMNPGSAGGLPIGEKKRLLDQSTPLATTLRLPGHIMLYLGKERGRHYVIHSIWSIQKPGKVQKIGKVVVSGLDLGEKGPKGSLLDRISDIRMIGSRPETEEK